MAIITMAFTWGEKGGVVWCAAPDWPGLCIVGMEEITIARFAAGHQMWMRPSLALKIAVQKAVRRAPSPLDENRYRLLTPIPVQTRCKYSLWYRRCPKQPKTDQAGRANHGSAFVYLRPVARECPIPVWRGERQFMAQIV